MSLKKLNWAEFKSAVDTRTLTIQYIEHSSYYDLSAFDGSLDMQCILHKDGSADQIDFDDNYKTNSNIPLSDTDNRPVTRPVFAKKGWTYLAHPIEFTTSKLNACYANDWLDNSRNNFDFKFYNSSGTELVAGTQAELDANCVETRVTLKPDYDYEIISGNIHQHTKPSSTNDVRLWVVGGVIDNTNNYPWEYPASSGVYHVKEFAGGLNLKFMGQEKNIETDGRASKFMGKTKTGVPYNANQFQMIIRHPVGYQHEMMLVLEYFRA
jgi:hypothetical protein